MSAAGNAGSRREPGQPVVLAVAVVAAPLLWIVFVSSSAIHEMMLGVVTSVATVIFSVLVARESRIDVDLRARDLAQCWRIPWYVLSGVFEITLVLIKDLLHMEPAGNFYRVCGFDSSTHDKLRIGRSVLAVAYTTTAPNFIVIGIDPAQSRMLFHQISRSSVSKMTRALGAEA